MQLLILGMVIFLAVHLVPTFVDLRQKLIGWKGEAFYKIGYSCAALAGLILIIIGKGRAAHVPVWDPPGWAYQVTQITMLLALILLPAAYLPSNLALSRSRLRRVMKVTLMSLGQTASHSY